MADWKYTIPIITLLTVLPGTPTAEMRSAISREYPCPAPHSANAAPASRSADIQAPSTPTSHSATAAPASRSADMQVLSTPSDHSATPAPASRSAVVRDDPKYDTVTVFDDFFEREEPLELILECDLKALRKNRKTEEYLYAKLICEYGDTCKIPYTVQIKPRGTFRKKHCFIPSFWLNIERAGIYPDEQLRVDKMKVVTHCRNVRYYEDYVLKEYLVYKLYNILTPYSFRVRLLKIKYVDTGRKNKTVERWSFVIEPLEMLANRVNAEIVEDDKLSMRTMNSHMMDQLSMFSYMVGNTDFSITGRHNIKIIKGREDGPSGYIPIPYDFDFTGMVNANYAVPATFTGLEKVTQRYYYGICRPDEVYRKIIDAFQTQNYAIHSLLQNFKYLDVRKKIEMLQFIELYFNAIASDSFIGRELRSTCR